VIPGLFKSSRIVLLFIIILLCIQCSKKKEAQQEESATSGKLIVFSDPSFSPVIDAEKAVFEALYPKASIEIKDTPELTALQKLFRDSADIIITGRPLSQKERTYFHDQQAVINEMHFATDALAFLINPKLSPWVTTKDTLKLLLNGTLKTWDQVKASFPNKPIKIVFDQSNSSNLQRAITKFGLLPSKTSIAAAGSNMEVIKHVSKNPYSLGVIGSAFISDEESAKAEVSRQAVAVVQLRNTTATPFSPFQSSLYDKENPFSRKIYIIRRNKRMDLGAGFTTFLMSDRGQRIVLKAGLLPAIMPSREVIITQ